MNAASTASGRCKVAIVGAGPQALTVAVHLATVDSSIVDDMVVVDPGSGWMSAWRQRFASQRIEHLRSPVVHQPAPDPYALVTFARKTRRSHELVGRYQLPSTRLFDDFCDHLVQRHGLDRCRRRSRVVRLAGDGTISLADGSIVHARHVVVANAPTTPIWPDGCQASDVVRHADDVCVDSVRSGSRVAVVGAGLSAGHLIHGAVQRGAEVVWVHRSPVVEREFDVDPGWLGPREMDAYLALTEPTERAHMAAAARTGGTLPGWMVRRLTQHESANRVTSVCGSLCRLESQGSAVRVVLEKRSFVVDEVWLATGHRPAVAHDAVIGKFLSDRGCQLAEGFPVLDALARVPGTGTHLIGRSATLAFGPTAGNLSGARHAARAIVSAVFGSDVAFELADRASGSSSSIPSGRLLPRKR